MLRLKRVCVCVCVCMCTQVWLTIAARLLCPWDFPGTLEWVAISYSRGSYQPRHQTLVSCVSCIDRQSLPLRCLGNTNFAATKGPDCVALFILFNSTLLEMPGSVQFFFYPIFSVFLWQLPISFHNEK